MYLLNADLLVSLETCPRQAVWSRYWESIKRHSTEVVYQSIKAALTDTTRDDRGELAGEKVIEFCADRGLDIQTFDPYGIGVHHASLADIITTQLSNFGTYTVPEPLDFWEPRCLLSKDRLKRILLVDHWTEDRLIAECHSWYTLGEMAAYELPMDLYIVVIGASKFGRRYSPWTRGLISSNSDEVRFEKRPMKKNIRKRKALEGFSHIWEPVWREDYTRFETRDWLMAMDMDHALEKSLITQQLSLPNQKRLEQVRADMKRYSEYMERLKELPGKRYGVCDWPKPCQFNRCCWGEEETAPSKESGFIPIRRLSLQFAESSSGRVLPSLPSLL